uniref:NADH-ubiquinone oxidoreductase chain 2 n=1 Tax=Paroedura sp. 1 EG-2007 TaxID=460144 RepID=A7XQG5_9SAUR|nr:NADH dehydrogenase subunit 2 [Paroedura sp. 1 EG-2007]
MNPTVWTLLALGLSTSTIITMSSHHWILAWLGLELNTLSILPMILKHHNPRATEAAVKYFIIQALSAALILFAGIMNTWQTGQSSITHMHTPIPTVLVTAALAMKLGLAPAHLWYMDIMQGMTTSTALIITTWQKIAPLALLYMMLNHLSGSTLLLIGLTSTTVGAWTGLNQTQMRKILAASSIAHMGWLITALSLHHSLATLTMVTYVIMTAAVFTTMITTSTKTLQDLGTAWSTTPPLLATTLLATTSLGGLPPLTGFMPKLLILKELTLTGLTPMSTLLALSTLPSLYFYIRMAYFTTLTTPPNTTNTEQKWRFKTTHPSNLTVVLLLATMLLPLTPLCHLTM